MGKKPWQFITGNRLVLLLTILGVAGAAIIMGMVIFSPGSLNGQTGNETGNVHSHNELSRRCDACHPPPWSADTMADRCLDCHTEVTAELQNPHELHSRILPAGEQWSCTSGCHTEHKGIQAPLTLITEKHFTREQRGFSLTGHQLRDDGFSFVCADCHQGRLDEFEESTCETCHADREPEFTAIHVDEFGQSCLKCHDGIDTYGEAFNHDEVPFPLQGKHASLPCADCHQGAQTITALKDASQDCYSCHQKDDKHAGQAGKDCAACHNADNWKQLVIDHDQTDYALTGSHVNVACIDCHIDNLYRDTATDCYSCHQQDDKHQGTAQDCAQCHDTSNWKQVNFNHDQTDYALTGSHVNVACTDCHLNSLFDNTAQDCYSCHQKDDKHQGTAQDCAQCHDTSNWKQVNFNHDHTDYALIGSHVNVACIDCHIDNLYRDTATDCYSCHQQDDKHQGTAQDCAQCHDTGNWKQVSFDHAQTMFPLTGGHVSAACNTCHASNVLVSIPTACNSCHQQNDAHNGSLGTNCAQCHNTLSWTQATIDHSLTAFPLTGSHSSLACSLCHTGGVYAGTPTACNSCHQQDDAHNGSRGTNCAQCHNTTGWTQATIDHSLTAFPLTGSHSSLACNLCHAGGVYAGTPTACNSCHQQNDAHNGGLGTDCVQCHNTTGWTQASIDHSLTAFPLTGSHISLACSSCHVGGVYAGTPTACNSCHQQNDAHNGSFGTNCAQCHNTLSWTQATIDHSLTAFPLTGSHASLACNTCHTGGVYAGTPMACNSCHQQNDAHNGSLGTNCAQCHNTTGWTQATIDHSLTAFPLTGSHTSLACSSCHAGGVYAGTPTACNSCHQQPSAHSGRLGTNCAQCHNTTGWTQATIDHSLTAFPLTGSHSSLACNLCHAGGVYAGTPTACNSCHQQNDAHNGGLGTDCAQCHNATGWTQATINHSLTAFPLTGSHASLACNLCHAGGVYAGTPTACNSCHQQNDAHNGSLGTNCAQCHSTTSWTQAAINHSLTAFPLTGSHTSLACNLCHAGGVYAGTPTACNSCHQQNDAHNGSLGTNCAQCHSTTSWTQATIDHSLTAFPLTGSHASLACSSCHAGGVYAGMPTACNSCHQQNDAHNGSFGTNCAQCHSTQAWLPAQYNRPHSFPLNHQGANSVCSNCHEGSLLTYTCYTGCHRHDPVGMNERHHDISNFGDDCARCHPTGRA